MCGNVAPAAARMRVMESPDFLLPFGHADADRVLTKRKQRIWIFSSYGGVLGANRVMQNGSCLRVGRESGTFVCGHGITRFLLPFGHADTERLLTKRKQGIWMFSSKSIIFMKIDDFMR